MKNQWKQKNFNTALSSALGYIRENYERVLYPLGLLKTNPDTYVVTIKVLSPSKTIDQEEEREILNFVLNKQRKDGSWPEILPSKRSEEKSVVFTSTVGCQLVDLAQAQKCFNDEVLSRLELAADFVCSRQRGNGSFRKSENVSLDTVNVDALASLFLMKCYTTYKQTRYITAGLRGATRVMKSQEPNGEFFYYPSQPKVPSVFYHAITADCLARLYNEYPDAQVLKSTVKAGSWMLKRQTPSGRFFWQGSEDHWFYREFATYPYAMDLFRHLSRYSHNFCAPFKKTLDYLMLSQAEDGSFPIQDSARTVDSVLEDFENIKGMVQNTLRSFPLSTVRATRMIFHGIKGPLAPLIYRSLHGGRNRVDDTYVSTVETVDRLLDCVHEALI